MLNELLKEIRNVNLCTWYLLPITGLTRFSFDGLFINSYLEKNRLWIIVQVPDVNLVPGSIRSHAIREWSNGHGGFLAYELTSYWTDDVQLYVEGKYSQFSDALKALIVECSGLHYREIDTEGKIITDVRLMVLDSQKEMRVYLAEELDVLEESLPADLLSAPPPGSFMDVTEV